MASVALAPHLGAAILLHLAALAALMLIYTVQSRTHSQNLSQEPLWIELQEKRSQRILLQESDLQSPKAQSMRPKDSSLLSHRDQVVERQTRASDRENPLSRLGALNGLSGRTPRDEIRSALQEESRQSFAGGLEDPNIPIGAETLLNTQQSVYYSFYSRLYQAIAPIWQSRIHQGAHHLGARPFPGRYTTRVAVKLDSAGNLKELRILAGSPLAFFDQVVIDSWQKIRQFPNPPAGLKDASGDVTTLWNFTVEIGEGQSWSLLPPRRI